MFEFAYDPEVSIESIFFDADRVFYEACNNKLARGLTQAERFYIDQDELIREPQDYTWIISKEITFDGRYPQKGVIKFHKDANGSPNYTLGLIPYTADDFKTPKIDEVRRLIVCQAGDRITYAMHNIKKEEIFAHGRQVLNMFKGVLYSHENEINIRVLRKL